MEIGKILRTKNSKEWRSWLEKNHLKEKEIWLVFYSKSSGKKALTYIEALDEALCFGWIDSIVKKLDADSRVQRFTPRKAKSPMSELNKEKVRRLKKLGRMTKAGLAVAGDLKANYDLPNWIEKELKKDPQTWKNFQKFPPSYRSIRIKWISELPNSRKAEQKKRLAYFIKMTKDNKRFGIIQD